MTQLVWVSVATVALTIWAAYRHRPLGAHDFGSVSVRWLEEYRKNTHLSADR